MDKEKVFKNHRILISSNFLVYYAVFLPYSYISRHHAEKIMALYELAFQLHEVMVQYSQLKTSCFHCSWDLEHYTITYTD